MNRRIVVNERYVCMMLWETCPDYWAKSNWVNMYNKGFGLCPLRALLPPPLGCRPSVLLNVTKGTLWDIYICAFMIYSYLIVMHMYFL